MTTGSGAAAVLDEVRTTTQAAITAEMMRRYGLVPASTITEQPTDWEWEGYLVRGALNLVEGNPETGKTLFVLTAVANISAGRPLPYGNPDPSRCRRVLFLTAEDSIAKTVIGRLKAANADLSNVLVQRERAADLVFAGAGIDDLREIVRGAGITTIVLDPLNAYLDGVDINKEMDVRAALRPMRDFAEDENVTLIGLRHLNKATDKPALYRGGGSIALTAVARSTLLIAKHPEDAGVRVLLSQKCNLIEEAKRPPRGFRIEKDNAGRPRIEWLTEDVQIDADELLGPRKPGPKPDTLERAKRFVGEFLASGARPRRDVLRAAQEAGLNEKAVERAASAMRIRSEAQGKERAWTLP